MVCCASFAACTLSTFLLSFSLLHPRGLILCSPRQSPFERSIHQFFPSIDSLFLTIFFFLPFSTLLFPLWCIFLNDFSYFLNFFLSNVSLRRDFTFFSFRNFCFNFQNLLHKITSFFLFDITRFNFEARKRRTLQRNCYRLYLNYNGERWIKKKKSGKRKVQVDIDVYISRRRRRRGSLRD